MVLLSPLVHPIVSVMYHLVMLVDIHVLLSLITLKTMSSLKALTQAVVYSL